MDRLVELDTIVKRLNTHPEYQKRLAAEISTTIFKEALNCSLKLEKSSPNGKSHSDDFQRLYDAWQYLLRNDITPGSLSKLGHIIEPEVHSYDGFRRIDGVNFGRFEGLAKQRIHLEINSLCELLFYNNHVHPVMRAIEAHIQLVNIHPYEDGNGRAARLVSSVVLQQNSYPTYLLGPDDREQYIHLMGETIKERRGREGIFMSPSAGEYQLQGLIVDRLFDSAKRIEEHLKEMRCYRVKLKMQGDKFEVSKKLGNRLRTYSRAQDRGLKVKVQKGILDVQGNISTEELESFVGKARDEDLRYNYSFTITPKN